VDEGQRAGERASARRVADTALHWDLEFPEVFATENPGFDSIVGNPPFLGGKRISTELGDTYNQWLSKTFMGASRNTDLVAHFTGELFI
jgi:methylase of polypeptide subunit release factors